MSSAATRILTAVCVTSSLFLRSLSQDLPIKWGEIPREDLEMKTYAPDPNASVLVLCDYGESSFDNNFDVVLFRHLRVKILTQKGYDWGTFSFVLADGNVKERLRDIEGATYALDEHGTVVKNELSDKDIFKQNIDGSHVVCRFTMPALKRGCVFEVRYKRTASSPNYLSDWTFQKSEPVRWSEYRIRCPRNLSYAVITRGYEPYTVRETKSIDQYFSGEAEALLGSSYVRCTQMRWVAQNLSALRDEPFVTTLDDYTNRVEVQLSGYSFRGSLPVEVLHNWDAMRKELLDNQGFGGKIDVTRRARKQAEALTAGLSTPEEKMRAIYKWVATSIVWNGQRRMFAEQSVNDVLDSKRGTSAEITFLLLSMLRSVEIAADPVILSTRDNGSLQDIYPIVGQFNYVLARAVIGSQTCFLDARDAERPLELLPTEVLNVRGLVLTKDAQEWVMITCPKTDILSSRSSIEVHSDGWISAVLVDSMKDYGAYLHRRTLADRNDRDIIKDEFDTEPTGLSLDSARIECRDSSSLPLVYRAWVTSPMYAQGNENFIYINPHIIHRTTTNVFKRQNREFPVDFAHTRDFAYTTVIAIPDSFELKESIGNRSFAAGPDLVTYSRSVRTGPKSIEVKTTYRVRETSIPPKYYQELKTMYGKMVIAEEEQFVLARIRKPEPPVQSAQPKPVTVKRKKTR